MNVCTSKVFLLPLVNMFASQCSGIESYQTLFICWSHPYETANTARINKL